MAGLNGMAEPIAYMEGRLEGYSVNYTEPAFVFAIMAMAATRPVIDLAGSMIQTVAKLLPLHHSVSFFLVAIILGPLLGSFITEPAAMTVTALILKRRYYDQGMTKKFMYATIGVLFVNVSVGGTLTHFAAPPVLMVAHTWDWDMMFMMKNFGWKSAIGVVINAVAVTALFKKELRSMAPEDESEGGGRAAAPAWLTAVHVLFMGLVVMNAHHMVVFLGIFLFFMGIVDVTIEHQDRLQLREALLVGFFLAGLVTLGGFQKWWLQPMISQLDELPLFLGATGLTAITDNAALTYLGSLVEGLQDSDKYALVAGAVAGGGLTVIANAPNPAGYGILKSSFGDEGISPIGLLLGALGPTLVVMACLWWLPSLE
jgi:Na+/H+ antiporter NhaD/arsenite permease-like protein